jgi:nucleoid DNA-binding protein
MARKKEAREGRNPATGEKITIPANIAPVFKPGKNLKKKVNN